MSKLVKKDALFGKIGQEYLLVNSCCEHLFISDEDFKKYCEEPSLCSSDTISLLKSRFFIYDENYRDVFNKIYKIKYDTKHSYLNNDTLLLMVVPTISCNCNCIYCQVNSKKNISKQNDMSLKTVLNFCDFVFMMPHKNIKIEFQGGEPTIRFDLVETIIRRISQLNKKYNKNIEYVICTNLLDISIHKIRILRKFKVAVSTSLDGPKNLHDRNRPSLLYNSTYEQFVNNLKLIRKYGITPSGLVTITSLNLHKMKEIIDIYIENDFNEIFLRPLNNYGCAFDNKNIYYKQHEYLEAYKEAVIYIIDRNIIEGIDIREEMFSIILCKIFSPFNDGFVDMQNPCSLGQMCLMVKQNGDVYPSDESRMISEMGNDYWKMGNINSYDCIEKMKIKRTEILKHGRLEDYDDCHDCLFNSFCYADPIKRWYIKNISGDEYETYCGIRKELFTFVFEQIRNANENKMKLFRRWANV